MKNKIFIRPTMEKGRDQKPKDEKARKRNTIINFRVTPEEKNRIEARIALTGLDRAEFFIESCLYQTVLVKGNVRTFREYDRLMKKLAEQINQDVKLENMDSELLESLRMILEILNQLFGKEKSYMAARKTTGEMIAEIEKKQEQMNARKKQLLKREAAENRKARIKRLIMIGAEVEKILGRPIEEKDLPKLIRFLENQEARGHFFSRAMAEEDVPKRDLNEEE